MRPETRTEQKFVDWCKENRIRQRKLQDQGEVGFPDRSVFLGTGRVVYIEFKAPDGDTSVKQDLAIEELLGLGCKVLVTDSAEEAIEWIMSQRYGRRTNIRKRQ